MHLACALVSLILSASTPEPGPGTMPASICSSNSLHEARRAFQNSYKAKKYGQALTTLEPLFGQCEGTLTPDQRAEILSDLAIAAFRGGDKTLCLKFIDRVPGRASSTADVAFAIENNRRLCAGDPSSSNLRDCRHAKTTDEESICADEILGGAHKQLKRVLGAAEDKIHSVAKSSISTWSKEFQRANRASLKLIEHDCGPLFALEFGPWGTGFNSAKSECESSHVRQWTQEIQNRFALPGLVAEEPTKLAPCSAPNVFDCPVVHEVEEKRELKAKAAMTEKPQIYKESELTASQQIAEWRRNTQLHEKLWLAWREAWCVSSLAAEVAARRGSEPKTTPIDAEAACLVRVTNVASGPELPGLETAKAMPPAVPVPTPVCTPLPPNSGVRFDGLYQDQGEGGWPPVSWSYLRFYADGTVLSVGSTGTPQSVTRRMDKSHKDNRVTCATANAGKIRMVEIFQGGNMEYDGTVEQGNLVLHVIRRSIGYEADRTYRFLPVHFDDAPGHAPSSPPDGSKSSK